MSINILDEMKNDFLIYATEVNTNRSLPDVRDGLKPSQRACLWEMYTKGYSSDKPHVKSAKVDGGVIANWHPHGSEYNTFGRMSQSWNNNIPEVDWHGANGSQLGGDQLAASRYTECRLSPAAEEGFFSNIKKDTVDFIPNFSEDMEWPSVFPAIFPRLFVNGSSGIGYTIAQEWEPGNLNEFTEQVKNVINKKKIDYNKIYPDYPTGGIIINKDSLADIYKTGKGSVILRAKTSVLENVIQVTELPYQVYAEPLIQRVKDLVNAEEITGIEDICNKSDDNGLLIEIECSDDPQQVLSQLYNKTDLQVSFSANQMTLVDGIPTMVTLKDYINIYINHNLSCIKREYQFDLRKFRSRKEIVDGLVKCLKMIDKVIETIKKSKTAEEAKNNLISEYNFTENQAKAIIDMKLGKLANLEAIALETEQIELDNEIRNCNDILSSEDGQKQILVNRLTDFTKKFGWKRRTQITQIDLVKEKAERKKKPKSEEQYIVAITKSNYIKRIKLVDYKPQAKVKNEADTIINAVKVSTKDKVILISENGMLYRLPAKKIGICTMNSTGTSMTDLFKDKIINILSGSETEPYLFLLTKNGQVKKMSIDTVFGIRKLDGTTIMKLGEGDIIIDSNLVNEKDVLLYSVGKKQVKIDTSKFTAKGKKAGGARGIKLKPEQVITK